MRLLYRLLLSSSLLAGVSQAQTAVTAAAGSLSIGSSPISTGTVVFVPVDASGHGIAITKAAGGVALPPNQASTGPTPIGFPCTISAGAITGTCVVPDSVASAPSGFAYNLTFFDTSTGNPTSGQTANLNQVHGITGATWALDHYIPSTVVLYSGAFTYTQGQGAPAGSFGPNSFYADISNPSAPVLYTNVNGTMVRVTGTGGAGTPGANGLSAYQVAQAAGYTGTQAQWLASLVGPQGPAGATGPQGPAGATGPQGAPGSGTGTPADVSTPATLGAVNGDGATVAMTSGVAHASGKGTFDADLLSFSASISNGPCYVTGTFSGTGSGTTLTVTGAQTALAPGSLLAGTGIPAGTTIVSQTDGITGFAGHYVTSNATTLSGSASNSFLFSEATGYDCARQKAALYSAVNHTGATARLHTGNYNQTYTAALPYRAYSAASVAVIGDGQQQCSVTAIAAMTSMEQSMYPGSGPNSSGPVLQGCSWNGNYKAQNVWALDNTDHVGLRDVSASNNDSYHGLGNSNVLFSCQGCGDSHPFDVHLGGGAGLTIYSGRNPEIQVLFSGGQISQLIVNQAAKTFVPGGGTGGTVGTYYWTANPVSGQPCVNPPSGRAFVSVAGAGYSSGTVDYVGECFSAPGTAFTLTYTGGSTVTGDTSTLTFWTLYNVGTYNDPYGNPYVPHLQYNGYGTHLSWPCAVMPAVYQGTNSGGANYNPQHAGELVNEPTFNLSTDGSATLLSVVPSATHTESGCDGTMFASIIFGPVPYTLSNFTMNDGGAEKFYLIGGARIGMVVSGGNPYLKNFHAQTATGIVWGAGVGTIQDYEFDSEGNTGIDIRGSTVKIKGGFYNSNGGNLPGAVVVRVETANSSQNSQVVDQLCAGTPGDAVNFRSFVNAGGDFSTTSPTFQPGQFVSNWSHCSNEHNLAQQLANENQSADIIHGHFVASLTTTASATDTVSMPGMLATGHCQVTPTNAAAQAAAQAAVTTKAAGSITVTHAATAGMTYDIGCTSF